MKAKPLSISEAVDELRSEVLQALANKGDTTLLFGVEEIELTLQIEVSTTGNVGASVGLWTVATIETGVDRSHMRTHQVRLLLRPHLKTSEGAPVSDVLIGDPDVTWTPAAA